MILMVGVLLLGMADDFDRLEGVALAGVPRSADAQAREVLTFADLGNLPNVLGGVRSAVVVVKTDEGNPARLLVSPALRKPPGNKGEPVPILVVERFETFEAGPATKRLARGREMILFDGFRLDLDGGQVVPEGQGGDVQFLVKGEGGPRLVASAPAKMFTLKKSPLSAISPGGGPSPGRAVLPGDFAGKYRLFANGQASGVLELKVEEGGAIAGRMRSDQTGGSYKVTGQVGPDPAHRVRFAVDLPRARQEFDGLLFLEGKGAIAGTYSLLDRPFGFFAIRDGGTIVSDGEDVGGKLVEGKTPGKVVKVEIGPGPRLVADGQVVDEAGLISAMKAAIAAAPDARALIVPAADTPYEKLARAMAVLQESGAASIRLETAPSGGK